MKQTLVLVTLFFVVFTSCQLETGYLENGILTDIPESEMHRLSVDEYKLLHVVGGVWISPKQKMKNVGDEFKLKVFANIEGHVLGAIGFQIAYNPQVITPDLNKGDKGVESDVFVYPHGGYVVNILQISPTEERLFIAGFHAPGIPPSSQLKLFTLNWIGVASGRTAVIPHILDLIAIDPITGQLYTLGTPTGYPGTVTIQ